MPPQQDMCEQDIFGAGAAVSLAVASFAEKATTPTAQAAKRRDLVVIFIFYFNVKLSLIQFAHLRYTDQAKIPQNIFMPKNEPALCRLEMANLRTPLLRPLFFYF
jgi:hypothetical protein